VTLQLHALSSSSRAVSSSSHNKKTNIELEEDIDPLFTLALTNNLGLIYRTMNKKVQGKIYFQNMFSTMMYLLDSSNQEDTSTPHNPFTWISGMDYYTMR